ncbi:MAG: ATP synthase subunit I [Burkholderiales bacterium RIFCSPLOWO2_12_FULL_61_40]|nr:MAG: ATP synthase subunit I [Burkholderiales bacterium RIFCSPLOWO2_12_FULL_61_40]
MSIIAPVAESEDESSDFVPLTAAQAQALREQNPSISPWRVVAGQVLVGVFVALAAWGVSGNRTVALSAAWGALAVVVPGALFARGLARQRQAKNAGAALLGFFVWELVKIVVSVLMLIVAPKLIVQLNWLALLTGFVLAMKVHWVAVWPRAMYGRVAKKK